MNTLNADAYTRIYSEAKYLETEDYADLISLLVDEYEHAHHRFYSQFNLDKRQKKFGSDDDQKTLHETALQIEVGIDACIRQFYARLQPPDQTFMNKQYFNKDFIRSDENASPANRVKNKLEAIRSFVASFQNRHKLELRRSYRYNNGRLSYSPFACIEFRKDGLPQVLLNILFKDFTQEHENIDLVDEIISNSNYFTDTANPFLEDTLLKKLKKTCEQINKRVAKETKNNTKLILHNRRATSLNPFAFDHIDRIQFNQTDKI